MRCQKRERTVSNREKPPWPPKSEQLENREQSVSYREWGLSAATRQA